MPYYNLKRDTDQKIFSTPAESMDAALAEFGAELGVRLTLEDTGDMAEYLIQESHKNPHWVNPTIPVFVLQN